jgi:hypothetical protein
MRVHWGKPSRTSKPPFFVKLPPSQLVYMLDRPERFHTLKVHFIPERRGSVPHIGEGRCPFCSFRLEECTYAPVLLFGQRSRRWHKAILPVGDPHDSLANTNYEGCAIIVGKPGSRSVIQRTMFLEHVRELPEPLPGRPASFDVRPMLLRRYGMFDEAAALEAQAGRNPELAMECEPDRAA